MTRALLLVGSILIGCTEDPGLSAVEVTPSGAMERGSMVTVTWRPVDALFGERTGPLEPERITVLASAGLTFRITRATRDAIDTLVAIDASAPLGRADAELLVIEGDTMQRFAAPELFELVDPEPVMLDDGATVESRAPSESVVAWVAPRSPLELVELEAEGPGAPELAWLDADGRFDRALAFSPRPLRAVLDGARAVVVRGASEPVTLHLRRTALRLAEASPAGASLDTASPLGAPDVYVASASLRSADDAAYFSVDLAPGAIGQRLYVETRSSDPRTDTRVTIYADDRLSVLGFPSDDRGALDAVLTPPIARAGRVYIRVSAGSRFDPAHGELSLLAVMR